MTKINKDLVEEFFVVAAYNVVGDFRHNALILKNEKFKGNLTTKFVDGKCVAYNKKNGEILGEKERLERLINRN